MAKTRQDKFLESLKDLQSEYSEYGNVLKLLIEQMTQGKASQVQAKLQQMKDEDW